MLVSDLRNRCDIWQVELEKDEYGDMKKKDKFVRRVGAKLVLKSSGLSKGPRTGYNGEYEVTILYSEIFNNPNAVEFYLNINNRKYDIISTDDKYGNQMFLVMQCVLRGTYSDET
ncbi:TPA: hypothetical protein RQN07_002745 [Aeromonas dhakensis]|uniref:hypothetical protein n=1 Tax=Aeromonas TaxID=642 RepID=UPI00288FF451|nr:hypothetical protein [Aeromonas dhakensis]HDX8469013.1 hypothetical protein [Aeromonas dhakensis]HDZ8869528.1 hypothetical protein [Aeromonas dhakensis]HDZ8931148.1 hypothetical protein [Aeromonas dhakensis]HEA3208354.1 hypothetical protein [Aeromonas dhakensis]